jgi:septal ring factor EnvC (AmiA/AmiB activator)
LKNPALNVNTELINPTAGLIKCCDCGRNMIANKFGNGKTTRLKHPNTKLCQKKSLPLQDVLDAFVEALNATIADLEVKMEADDTHAELAQHQARIDHMESELSKLERKLKKVTLDYHDEVYTRAEYIEWKQYYTKEIEEIKKQIQEAQSAFPEPVNYSEQIVNLHRMIECVTDPDISAKKKNDFLKQFIDHITYDAIDHGRSKGGKVILEVFLK